MPILPPPRIRHCPDLSSPTQGSTNLVEPECAVYEKVDQLLTFFLFCCIFRLDETCSHVAAILFKTQAAVIMGLNSTSCTSKACQWNKAFKSKVAACRVAEMKLSEHSSKRMKKAALSGTVVTEQVKSQMKSEILRFARANRCVYLTSVDESGIACQDSGVSFTLVKACQMASGGVHDAVNQEFCYTFFRKLPSLYSDATQLSCLERKTRSQKGSKLWFDHRQGRLTASVFGDVMRHVTSGQPSPSLLERVVVRGTSISGKQAPKALQWGTQNEQQAIDMLVGALSDVHVNHRYERVGLIVKQEYPHLHCKKKLLTSVLCGQISLTKCV